jgi:hypothetical protein
MELDSKTYRLSGAGGPGRIAGIIGIIALAVSFIGVFTASKEGGADHARATANVLHMQAAAETADAAAPVATDDHAVNKGSGHTISRTTQFFQSYLNAFTFWVTVGLGGLFATLVHHLVRATWSVVMRRMYESLMVTLPILIIFFIPIALWGMQDLYHWTNASEANDPIFLKKEAWLSPKFFCLRAVVYFVIWFILARLLYSASLKQDESPSEALSVRMRMISAPGLILFAATTTLAAFDWIMSLNYHWFSTIFGIYIFAGAYLSCTAFCVLVTMYLRSKNILTKEITDEHYHDMGKWLFAFVVFWSYIAFSQFFLIWYANLPEETGFFKDRGGPGWMTASLMLVICHFAIPFFFLLSSLTKRSPKALVIAAVWLLAVHWFDHYWLIAPNFHESFAFSWLDVTCWLGIGGIFFWNFWRKFTSAPVVPVKDPQLEGSINFANFWV